jgi:N utilization substance protein B
MSPRSESTSRTARGKARKRALDVLYEADLRGIDPMTTVADRLAQADPPVPDYAVELVEGVTARRARIDELIATYSEGWTIDRMPPVDRNLLRIAIFELLWCDEVPDAVAISEAVDLAKDLSTDESPRFVNGLLGRLQLLKAELVG